MKNRNIDPEELYKDTKKKLIWAPVYPILVRLSKKGQTIFMIVVIIFVFFIIATWLLFDDQIKKKANAVLGVDTGEKILEKGDESHSDNNLAKDNIEKDRIDNKCKGAQFGIFSDYFEPVGNERFYKEEVGVSARNTEYYQASYKSNWACNIPFVAQVVAIPLSGQSFGLFFEYEDVFRVLVGDGDRVTLKVEQNKLKDRKSEWQPVLDKDGKERQKLGNQIADGEEVTLEIKVKESDGKIVLHINVYHSKFQNVEPFDYVFTPNAINIQAPQPRNFRVGLNDFRFKGTGSVLDLKTLSVDERE
ncbi:MAG: hypothetical protein UT24_C0014G0021 [Candidatus Woesebacteria bacterium GW2011_GWB1_39_12]|uniref:Uncharacterized protein n=2 Tax=Candidatus Woeseibacteriota TaxID=1752722 RepID=A0A0G0M4I5_9BACT|nr:MAG: hypothetical protein UT23_C0004G0046 [Candidatus Woesebacteria bacterium GW2011_GWA1_39_12]KKR00281.1 MAG: hypothetical protein UT24_C0014G0021 [Candidatus Woesebacteria bacterium GW2011_GWB1_39_12]